MKLHFKKILLALLLFSTTSFNVKNEPVASRELNLCDAVKQLVPIFTKGEIKKLLEAKIVSEDLTQWSSRIKIEQYKEEYIYDDGKDSYFEAVLDRKISSVDALETELGYIAASLEGCLKVESTYIDEEKYSLYFFIVDDVRVSIASKSIYEEDRSIILRIEYD